MTPARKDRLKLAAVVLMFVGLAALGVLAYVYADELDVRSGDHPAWDAR
jgi:hypothetical protein